MKLIIIGGGFAGLTLAQQLKNAPVDITLIDKTNHHVFQPLLYQVATAALAPGDIAVPIRSIFSKQKNVTVVMGEVTAIDRERKNAVLADGRTLAYDLLVAAPGARHSYFGNDNWERFSPGLKTISDALTIREMLMLNLEKAEQSDPEEAIPYLNFVVVGGGPTGVELAGAIAEISRETMMKDFRRISPGMTHVYLIEALPEVLNTYSTSLSKKSRAALERLGVKVLTNTRVQKIDAAGVTTTNGYIPSKSIIWAAGNQASPLLKSLNVPLDRAGRALVTETLNIPGDDSVFVLGDAAAFLNKSGKPLPGTAPVAMQQGRYVARLIKKRLADLQVNTEFSYLDKGSMATIGRAKAIAQVGKFEFSGIIAWLMWSVIHVFYLIGFRNRFRVMAEWIWYYITFKGGFRLITGVHRDP